MTDTYNIAALELDTNIPLPNIYFINAISYQESPYDNIPEGCSLVAFVDISTFSIKVGPTYLWRSIENAVVNGDGVPLYLIGDFYQT